MKKPNSPTFFLTYWNPFNENAPGLGQSLLNYAKDVNLSNYQGEIIGSYITNASNQMSKIIADNGIELRNINEMLKSNFKRLDQTLIYQNQILANQGLVLEEIKKLLLIPDSEKERIHKINQMIKFFNAAYEDNEYQSEVIEILDEILSENEYDWYSHYHYGLAFMFYEKIQDLEKSKIHFEKAFKYAKVETNINLNPINTIFHNLDRISQKKTLSRRKNPLRDFQVKTLHHLALCDYTLCNFSSAANFAQEAFEIDKSNIVSLFYLCKYLARINDDSLDAKLALLTEHQEFEIDLLFTDIDLMSSESCLKIIKELRIEATDNIKELEEYVVQLKKLKIPLQNSFKRNTALSDYRHGDKIVSLEGKIILDKIDCDGSAPWDYDIAGSCDNGRVYCRKYRHGSWETIECPSCKGQGFKKQYFTDFIFLDEFRIIAGENMQMSRYGSHINLINLASTTSSDKHLFSKYISNEDFYYSIRRGGKVYFRNLIDDNVTKVITANEQVKEFHSGSMYNCFGLPDGIFSINDRTFITEPSNNIIINHKKQNIPFYNTPDGAYCGDGDFIDFDNKIGFWIQYDLNDEGFPLKNSLLRFCKYDFELDEEVEHILLDNCVKYDGSGEYQTTFINYDNTNYYIIAHKSGIYTININKFKAKHIQADLIVDHESDRSYSSSEENPYVYFVSSHKTLCLFNVLTLQLRDLKIPIDTKFAFQVSPDDQWLAYTESNDYSDNQNTLSVSYIGDLIDFNKSISYLSELKKRGEKLNREIEEELKNIEKESELESDKKQKESSNVDKGSKSSALGCLTLIVFCGLIYWMFFYSSYSDEQLSRACECYENSYDYTGKPGDDLSQSDLKIRVDCFDLFKPDDFKLLEDDINEIDKMMQDACIEAR